MRLASFVGAAAGALLARSVVRRLTAYDVHGKVALVTGGSRGLGLELARELVRHGARVAICARHLDQLESARDELARDGGEVIARACDLTDPGELDRLVLDVERRLGPIDVLVNNAGTIQVGPYDVMRERDYRRAMDTHFWAPLRLVEAVLPAMIARGDGRILNIASIGGRIAVPHLLPYTASKFALVGWSEGLREEVARSGVRVTTAVPGLMRTGGHQHARFKGHQRAEYRWFAAGATLPLTAMSVRRAARTMIAAMRRGAPEIHVGLQAKLAARAAAFAPNLVQRALSVVDRLLPAPGGSTTSVPGRLLAP